MPDLSHFSKLASARLGPEHLTVNPALMFQGDGLFTCIYHPTPVAKVRGNSLSLGLVEDWKEEVLKPGAARPRGTYAIFRTSDTEIEILSDYVASRTVWYYRDHELFVASTSQRLVVAFLGTFEANQPAIRWMLSTGTLGPCSWDRRLRSVPQNSVLRLCRSTWELSLAKKPLEFTPANVGEAELKANLYSAIEQAISGLDLQPNRWTLALSGGMDSRAVLYHVKRLEGLNTVTWGLQKALGQRRSDATIARHLATECRLPHSYVALDPEYQGFETVLRRFVTAGEGRIDHISGYMDGLELWRELSSAGHAVLRGYDALGRKPPVVNEHQARRASGLALTADYRKSLIPEELQLGEDDIPDYLHRAEGEPLHDWRDRLWLQFRTPYMTAALDEIKVAYVELANPLLSETVVRSIQMLPHELRTNKALFKKIVAVMFPGVPFARREVTQPVESIVSRGDVADVLRKDLLLAQGKGVLPDEFLRTLADSLSKNETGVLLERRMMDMCKAYMPLPLENILRTRMRRKGESCGRLALRASIILRVHELLCS